MLRFMAHGTGQVEVNVEVEVEVVAKM